jgi:2-oxoacid:acceptor oxidoreductase delta subunit (pyruvate/2-ketoisovalerate family)
MKPCEIPPKKIVRQNNRRQRGNKKIFSTEVGLTEKGALEAARQCLGMTECSACDVCQLLCPELCITRDESTGRVLIDLDYCKGCGICASVCPKGAIKMVLEGTD